MRMSERDLRRCRALAASQSASSTEWHSAHRPHSRFLSLYVNTDVAKRLKSPRAVFEQAATGRSGGGVE